MSKCCGQGDVLLFACSGGSNVGQISNDAAKALDQLGQGSFFCLIGVGAKVGPIVERTQKDGTTIVAIDGCSVACAKKALEQIGVAPDVYVDVTQLGIEKGHHFQHTAEEVGKTAQAVVDALNSPTGCCGFATDITATSDDEQCVRFAITSPCANIQGLAAALPDEIDAYQEIGNGYTGVIWGVARDTLHGCCSGCIVPIALFKAMQVAARIALPAASTIYLTLSEDNT